MSKAKLLLKNDVGLVLDITESPLGCTVYDLEGNEISGSGGSVSFDICNIKIVNTKPETIQCLVLPQLLDNALIVNDESIDPIIIDANSEYEMALPFTWSQNPDAPVIMIMLEHAVASDAVNCSYSSGEPGFITRTANGNASITLTL